MHSTAQPPKQSLYSQKKEQKRGRGKCLPLSMHEKAAMHIYKKQAKQQTFITNFSESQIDFTWEHPIYQV